MTSPYPSDLLAGRTAIVTGSTKGIGLGIAQASSTTAATW
jgi:NAD(P)-dependent dehydrogenase (short-subunit alcohol dehydrogenase family)